MTTEGPTGTLTRAQRTISAEVTHSHKNSALNQLLQAFHSTWLLNSLLAAVQKNMPECDLSMNNNAVTMSDEFVHSGLVKFERRHVMSILAHEMGHYYNFHTCETLREMAGYKHRWKEHYFRIPEYTNRTQKPVADKSPAVLSMFNAHQ